MGVEFLESEKNIKAIISGEIDHHSASLLRNQIDDNLKIKKKDLILDLSKVTFMDTSGIGLILGRFKLSKNLGISMKVVNIPEKIQRIIELSGIKKLGIL